MYHLIISDRTNGQQHLVVLSNDQINGWKANGNLPEMCNSIAHDKCRPLEMTNDLGYALATIIAANCMGVEIDIDVETGVQTTTFVPMFVPSVQRQKKVSHSFDYKLVEIADVENNTWKEFVNYINDSNNVPAAESNFYPIDQNVELSNWTPEENIPLAVKIRQFDEKLLILEKWGGLPCKIYLSVKGQIDNFQPIFDNWKKETAERLNAQKTKAVPAVTTNVPVTFKVNLPIKN